MRDVRSKSYRRASVRKSKRQSRCSNSIPSSNFSMHSIDRSMYRIPPSPVGGRPVARRRPREISLSQMQTTAPCSGRAAGVALHVLISGVEFCGVYTVQYTALQEEAHPTPAQAHQQHHHHRRPTSSVMKSPADPPVPLPGPVHPIGDECSRPQWQQVASAATHRVCERAAPG